MTTMIDSPARSLPLGLQPATIPFGMAKGHPNTKVLTDGSKFFCADGDYEADSYASVFAHRQKHAEKRSVSRTVNLNTLRAEATRLLEKIDQVETVLNATAPDAEFEAMRERALRAERKLAKIKAAFGDLVNVV